RPGPREVRMRDCGPLRLRAALPLAAGPPEPAVLILIEDVQRFVAQLGEFGAPSRAATHGSIVQDGADHVYLLAIVHLVPERLQHLPDRGPLRIAAVHEPRHVFET